jgi:hypothetical protein
MMRPDKQRNPSQTALVLSSRQRLRAALAGLAIAGLLAWLFLAQRLGCDVGSMFGPCGFKQRYGLPCPTCGMTTAVLAFTRGEVAQAFEIQPAAALVCAALVASAGILLTVALQGRVAPPISRMLARMKVSRVLICIGLIGAVGWAVTLWRALQG